MCGSARNKEEMLCEPGEGGKELKEGALRERYFSQDFCAALDTTTLPIYIIDPESFRMCYCNESVRENLGGNPLGLPCYKAIRGLDEPCPDCVAKKLRDEGVNETKEYYAPGKGWVLVRVSPLKWRGKEYYELVAVDITKQKLLEAELRLRTKEYGAVARQSTAGIVRYDIATGTASVNVDSSLNRVEEYVILDYLQVIRQSGMLDQDSLPAVEEMFRDIQTGRESRGYDLLLTPAKGEARWCRLDYSLIEDEEGRPYRAVVCFHDITEQRERELAYQHWNARLNTLMDEYTAYLEVNLTQDVIEAEGRSGSWDQEVGGRRYSEFIQEMELEEIFLDDRPRFHSFFHRERLLGQFYAGDTGGSLEYRVVGDGEPQWYKSEIQMIKDPVTGDVKTSIVISNVDVTLRERESLTRRAQRDVMTGLYNHATAETMIQEALEKDGWERCCFLIIDLDDLRDINGSFGHPEGDKALKLVAECMSDQFGQNSILGRMGGDEFVALLRDVSEDGDLHKLVSGFLEKLNKLRIGPNGEWPVQASVGGAMGTTGRDDFKSLYHQADLALFYTKATGKNTFHMYSPELEKREFSYQPSSAATLSKMDSFDSAEFKKLLQAVSVYFPMVISVNLTQNTYYMMEYMSYAMQKHKDHGNFDRLIVDGASSFHPDDQESFVQSFSRENLLKAYARGERVVRHIGRQLGDDGVYRLTQGMVIFVNDENTGDICEITFSHVSYAGMD